MTVVETEKEPRYASYSSLVRHRVCPRSWHYSSVRKLARLEGDDAAVERDMGSWWHMLQAADSIHRGRFHQSLQWVPEKLASVDDGPTVDTNEKDIVASVMLEASIWWGKQSDVVQQLWTERIGEDLPNRLWAVYARWQDQWAAEIATERPLAVELRWERRLPALTQPGRLATVDPRTVLVGYVDEVYFDTKRRVVVVRDHKLHKKLGTQTAADDMMDSQLQLYAWGAAPVVESWAGQIRATSYDRVRMVKPPMPQVTASGGLSKSVTDYDLHTYQEWAKGSDGQGVPWGEEGKFFASGPRKGQPKFGRYEATEKEIDRLSSPAVVSGWFQRTLIPINQHVIQAHLRAAVDSALDMGVTYERAQITHEAPRNLARKVCQFCDFAGLCRSEMFGGAQGSYDLADFKLMQKPERQR